MYRRRTLATQDFTLLAPHSPSISVSATLMVPHIVVPDTTVPTPGTEKVSSIWNSAGASGFEGVVGVNRFKNIFNKSKF